MSKEVADRLREQAGYLSATPDLQGLLKEAAERLDPKGVRDHRKPVRLREVYHGSLSQGRHGYIYAHVVDEEGDLIMSATLDVILQAAKDRGWRFVK